jgi:MFS family permease
MSYLARNGIGSTQKKTLLSSFVGWMFDGYETSALILVGFVAISSMMPADTDPAILRLTVGYAISATLLGWAIGGVIGSIYADYIGRKKMLLIAILGYSVFTGVTALTQTPDSLIALRFITGLFLGSEWATGTALIAETWPKNFRSKALGIMQSGFGFGFLLASGLWLIAQPLLGPTAWRWMFVFGVMPAILLIYIRRALPESELWAEAMKNKQWTTTEQNKSSTNTGKRPFTLTQVFGDSVARYRMFLTLILCSITVAVFYGTSVLIPPYIGSLAAKNGLDPKQWATLGAVIYNVGAIIGYISAGFLADALGRKKYMFLIFTGGLIIGPVMFNITPELITALIFTALLGMFTLGAFSWMPIYLPELFATNVRSTATGFVFNTSRLIATPAPIYAAILFTSLGGPAKSVTYLCLLFIISIIVVIFLPETKGKPLPK